MKVVRVRHADGTESVLPMVETPVRCDGWAPNPELEAFLRSVGALDPPPFTNEQIASFRILEDGTGEALQLGSDWFRQADGTMRFEPCGVMPLSPKGRAEMRRTYDTFVGKHRLFVHVPPVSWRDGAA